MTDDDRFGLPIETPLFVMPRGLSMRQCRPSKLPLPSLTSVVFTDSDGNHVYAAALSFFEKLSRETLRTLQLAWFAEHGSRTGFSSLDDLLAELGSDESIHAEKCIVCIMDLSPNPDLWHPPAPHVAPFFPSSSCLSVSAYAPTSPSSRAFDRCF